MAIPISTVWEARSATGSPTNGAGFVPGSSGTDYSQQTSPQYSLTNGAANGTTTILTSSASADMVGNIVYIAGGTGTITATRRQIVSVSVGVSITVDSSSGLTTGTGVTLNIGGASNTVSGVLAFATQANVVYFKGSETLTSTLTLSLTYPGSSPGIYAFTIQGYGTTRGDTGHATITTATNSTDLITVASNAGQYILRNIVFSNTAGTPAHGIIVGSSGAFTDLLMDHCRVTGFTYGFYGPFSGQYIIVPIALNNCEIDNCSTAGIYNAGFVNIAKSYVHDCPTGINALAANFGAEGFCAYETTVANCTVGIISGSDPANTHQVGATLLNCNFFNNSSAGWEAPSTTICGMISNCIFYGNGIGIDGNDCVFTGLQDTNAFGGNTHDRTGFPAGTNDIALTANPWTNASAGDFSLNSTSGGGAAVKSVGVETTVC